MNRSLKYRQSHWTSHEFVEANEKLTEEDGRLPGGEWLRKKEKRWTGAKSWNEVWIVAADWERWKHSVKALCTMRRNADRKKGRRMRNWQIVFTKTSR